MLTGRLMYFRPWSRDFDVRSVSRSDFEFSGLTNDEAHHTAY
jgi:hypothetical protein